MVDWKKDIKLSDLLARGGPGEDAPEPDSQERRPFSEAPSQHEPHAEGKFLHEAEPVHAQAEPFEADPAEAETSDADSGGATPFWKRELSFRRQKDDESFLETVDEPEQPEDVADDGEKTSFFKRELSFRREKTESDSDSGAGTPADERQKRPFFKRELGFGRRKDEELFPELHDDDSERAEEVTDAREKTPFWKRELSFGRDKDEGSFPETVDELEQPDDRTDAHEKTPFWKRELSFGRDKDEGSFPETVNEPAQPEDSATAFEKTPVVTPELGLRPERKEDSLPEPAVQEEEPAQMADAEEKPFLKRELSFRRRRSDPAPDPDFDAGEEAPEQPSFVHELSAEVTDLDNPEAEKRSFFKRELSFRRPKHSDFDAPQAEKRSLFKRDFSFRRPKDPDFDAPKTEKRSFFGRTLRRKGESAHEFELETPKPEKRPFFKRELSFRRGKPAGREVAMARAQKGGRKKQLVGLKVGASQIAAARVVNNGSPELVQLARQSIESGIVVGGELRDPEALADALRDFFAKHKLPNRNVRLGIGNNRIGVRSFEISGVHDPAQLENAIRFRAQEALPIPLDEAVLDYHVIDETVSPTGIRTYRVLLVLAYRDLVDRYIAACRSAGLRLAGIDLEAFALLRALSPPASEGFPDDSALVAVSIGHDRSTFAVSNGTVCEFTRVLDWGGSLLNTAIARALDITPTQAEPVKRALTLNTDEGETRPPSDDQTARAEEAVRLELQAFARELVSSLHFYQNQPAALTIGSIMLTGGTAHMPGLAAELQRLIGIKVRVGDPLRRVKTAKRVETPDQLGSLAVAIGLGIED